MADKKKTPTPNPERRAKMVKTGVAVGVGSAAIVAALLYAKQHKKGAKKD